MKVIPPYQISTEIIDLINRAKKYVVLVSPYVDFTKWERIKYAIKKAKDRGIKIEFFTRHDAHSSREQIQALGIEPKLIYYLHAKLYYNEEKGIVTSMNLLTSSSLNAIEFGAVYDTESELKELQRFVKEFLLTPEEVAKTPIEYVSLAKSNLKRVNAPEETTETPSKYELSLAKEKFIVVLENEIRKRHNPHTTCCWDKDERNDKVIKIWAGNSFYLDLSHMSRRINMYLKGIISPVKSKHVDIFVANIFIKDFSKKYPNTNIYLDNGKYNKHGHSAINLRLYKCFTSDDFESLNVSEKKEIIDITLNFIKMLNGFNLLKTSEKYELYFDKEEFSSVLNNEVKKCNVDVYVTQRKWDGAIFIQERIGLGSDFSIELDKINNKMYIKRNRTSYSLIRDIGIFIKNFTKKYPNFETFFDLGKIGKNSYPKVLLESKKSFSSNDFNLLNISEKKEIIDITLNFIKMLMYFKHHHG